MVPLSSSLGHRGRLSQKIKEAEIFCVTVQGLSVASLSIIKTIINLNEILLKREKKKSKAMSFVRKYINEEVASNTYYLEK